MFNVEKFSHAGKEYEVRITPDQHSFHVRAYLDGHPANGYSYQVDKLTYFGARASIAQHDLLQELINTAISDVEQGRWERYVEAARGPSQN